MTPASLHRFARSKSQAPLFFIALAIQLLLSFSKRIHAPVPTTSRRIVQNIGSLELLNAQ